MASPSSPDDQDERDFISASPKDSDWIDPLEDTQVLNKDKVSKKSRSSCPPYPSGPGRVNRSDDALSKTLPLSSPDKPPPDGTASTDRGAFDLEDAKIQAEAHGVLIRQIHIIRD